MKVGVIGPGQWGQALTVLAQQADNEVLHGFTGRRPRRKLPLTKDLREVARFAETLLVGVPAWALRDTLSALDLGPEHRVILCTRGPDPDTGRWLTQVVPAVSPCLRVGLLGGPILPAEVLQGIPCSAVVASSFSEVTRLGQEALHSPSCRVYTSDDPHAVELAGAMSQVLAVAVGVADSMKLGVSLRATVITRGLAEMRRMAQALDVDTEALSGLAGIGDLVASTSHPEHEAYSLGLNMAEPRDITETEPVLTAGTALNVAKREGIELPLTKAVWALAHKKVDPATAMRGLMERARKSTEGA